MRKLDEVIDQIMEIIPVSEEHLRAGLEDIKDSYNYAPPENHSLWWIEAAMTLQDSFPKNDSDFQDWHKKVISIWMGEEDVQKDS